MLQATPFTHLDCEYVIVAAYELDPVISRMQTFHYGFVLLSAYANRSGVNNSAKYIVGCSYFSLNYQELSCNTPEHARDMTHEQRPGSNTYDSIFPICLGRTVRGQQLWSLPPCPLNVVIDTGLWTTPHRLFNVMLPKLAETSAHQENNQTNKHQPKLQTNHKNQTVSWSDSRDAFR